MNLILASASPRRADLLRQSGIPFQVIKPDISESMIGNLSPEEIAVRLAMKKALAVARQFDQGIVLAADTMVFYQGAALGKPADQDDARHMLSILSGDVHQVLTGIVLIDAASGKSESGYSLTRVWFKDLTENDINAYIATGEPYDKAGAYGIQGRAAMFVVKIEGCYFNVVGLPLSMLHDLIKRIQGPTRPGRKDLDNAK